MGYKVPKQPLEYYLVGACTFYDKETIKALGYDNHKNLIDHKVPILLYGKGPELKDCHNFFGKTKEGKFKYIHPDIVKEYYDLKTAEEEMPELFI